MEEQLTVYDDRGNPLGVAPRSEVHRRGLLHQVGHCWIVSPRPDGLWLWFQQRSGQKAEFPGYLDIAVGGHIGAGEQPLPALLREIREEVGLELGPGDLVYLGESREELRFRGVIDREIAQIYLYIDPDPAFCPGEEVDQMVCLPVEEYAKKELEGAVSVRVWAQGRARDAAWCQWCRHPGEFEGKVLPALRERGLWSE